MSTFIKLVRIANHTTDFLLFHIQVSKLLCCSSYVTSYHLFCESKSFEMEPIYFVKLSERATLPTRAYNSIGLDLSSAFKYVINPGKRLLISTDLMVRFPPGTYGRISPRPGLALRKGVDIGAGVIDPGYRGNIGIVLINHGEEDFIIQPGDRIAQLICERACIPEVFELKEFPKIDETMRGNKGFGSTRVCSSESKKSQTPTN